MLKICPVCLLETVVEGATGKSRKRLCEACRALVDLQAEALGLGSMVQQLEHPALVVNAEGRVMESNEALRGWLGQDDPRGLLLGDLFDCRHANGPGGCGRAEACGHCTLRNLLRRAFTSQHERRRSLASLPRRDGSHLRFFASALPLNGAVQIMLDPA